MGGDDQLSYGATCLRASAAQARERLPDLRRAVFGVKWPRSRAVDTWSLLKQRGKFHAVGVGGALTGKGGSVMLLTIR
jgi:hypothetical protein